MLGIDPALPTKLPVFAKLLCFHLETTFPGVRSISRFRRIALLFFEAAEKIVVPDDFVEASNVLVENFRVGKHLCCRVM